jgi:transcriptional regulator of PTS gene
MIWTFLENPDDSATQIKQKKIKRAMIRFLLNDGAKSIPELCTHTRLSVPTGAKLVEEMLEQNILVDSGKRDSSGGRRPNMYALNPNQGYVIGVELLLRSFRLTIVNLLHEVVFEYENDDFNIADKTESFAFLTQKVSQIIREKQLPREKILGICIGITGRVDPKQGISYSYLNFEEPLSKMLYDEWKIPVFLHNDTHLMARGEKAFGLAQGKKDVIYLNIGRGLGAGIFSNNQLHQGHSGFAGELGHIFAANNDKRCVCGKKGCLETVVSGQALEDSYQALKGERLHYRQIIHLAEKGDQELREIMATMGEQLGRSLAVLIDLFNPELIVVGGGFSSVGDIVRSAIDKGISLHSLPQLATDCAIRVSELGDRAEMLGAFDVVFEQVFQPEEG